MAYAEKILPHYTYEEYVQWEGKWELIEGFPIAMSPAPSPKHQWVSTNLAYLFKKALLESGCGHCKAYMPIDYKVAEDTVLQPDLLVVCGEINKKFLDKAPVLVVEILSASTALRDRHTKFGIYQQEGVKYYLLVNTELQTVEVFENRSEGFELLDIDASQSVTFQLESDCSITFALDRIWE
jgi:Uma2 family endonuclease